MGKVLQSDVTKVPVFTEAAKLVRLIDQHDVRGAVALMSRNLDCFGSDRLHEIVNSTPSPLRHHMTKLANVASDTYFSDAEDASDARLVVIPMIFEGHFDQETIDMQPDVLSDSFQHLGIRLSWIGNRFIHPEDMAYLGQDQQRSLLLKVLKDKDVPPWIAKGNPTSSGQGLTKMRMLLALQEVARDGHDFSDRSKVFTEEAFLKWGTFILNNVDACLSVMPPVAMRSCKYIYDIFMIQSAYDEARLHAGEDVVGHVYRDSVEGTWVLFSDVENTLLDGVHLKPPNQIPATALFEDLQSSCVSVSVHPDKNTLPQPPQYLCC